jgi:hypothetical protein
MSVLLGIATAFERAHNKKLSAHAKKRSVLLNLLFLLFALCSLLKGHSFALSMLAENGLFR